MIIIMGLFFGIILLGFYKRSPFLKLHVHNLIGYYYEKKSSILLQNEKEKTLRKKIPNSIEPLSFKSYINDTQNVHPKVLYFEKGFAGHKFWMAYTPYPWYIDRYENPSIAFSEDGFDWTNIPGNPIDDPKGNGYNSDTHLVYSNNHLECWFRYVGNYNYPPVCELIYRSVSNDGISWTVPEIMIENNSGKYANYMSPSVIWDGTGYHIWTVSSEGGLHIEYHTMSVDKQLKKEQDIFLDFPSGVDNIVYLPWHLDVIKDKDEYIYLIMCKNNQEYFKTKRWDLFLVKSNDNVNFTVPEIVIQGNPIGWDKNIYRSTIVRVMDEYRIYYSALDEHGRHGIGICKSNQLCDFEAVNT